MSHEHITSDAELNAIEAALGSLAPARGRLDRDFVMFQAGRAAAGSPTRGRRAWIATAASLGLIALGQAVLLAHRPSPQIVERVVVVREPARSAVEVSPELAVITPPAVRGAGDPLALGYTAYGRLTEQVLRYGLDGLPAPPMTAWTGSEPGSATSRQLLAEELRRVLKPGDPS